jgi:hypothetical protein
MELRDLVESAALWTMGFTIALFAFLAFGAPYLLQALGWLFEAMGGVGVGGVQ